jgi:hypothetical protein
MGNDIKIGFRETGHYGPYCVLMALVNTSMDLQVS